MKSRLFVAVLLALALLGLVLPGIAQAGEIVVFRFDGLAATAFFSSTDPSGCILSEVFLGAQDESQQVPPGPASTSRFAYTVISVYDFCTSTSLLDAAGLTSLADAEFQVAKTLESATLNTTIPVFVYGTGSTVDVGVAMTWTSTGEVSRLNDHNHVHFESPEVIANSHILGVFRPTVASGTVTDGLTNFTPNPTISSFILSEASGGVRVTFD
jgi:hypothetical protein